jgi:hypothetical protein
MNEEKKSKIYQLMESIENDESKRVRFVSWFRKMVWYVDAGMPFSEGQLNEIIQFLESIK